MYCCRSRDLSFSCSIEKCTSLALVAVKTLMGIDTRPNEMVPDEIARAGMPLLLAGGSAQEGTTPYDTYFWRASFTPETPIVSPTPTVVACTWRTTPLWLRITSFPAPPPIVLPATAAR